MVRILAKNLSGQNSFGCLNRRTRHITIGTEYAAMSFLSFQNFMTRCAFIKELAVVGWHLYALTEATMRACQCAFRNNIHNRYRQLACYSFIVAFNSRASKNQALPFLGASKSLFFSSNYLN